MKVLLSIKPEFAYKIFEGSKQYEYRRVIFKNKKIKKIIVYASAPVSKIIGEFEIDEVIEDEPKALWQTTKKQSGISEEYFTEYFDGKNTGFAIKVKKTQKYRNPKCLKQTYGVKPPQSFQYIHS